MIAHQRLASIGAPMKELRGSASAVVGESVEESFRLLAAVDRYPTWNGAPFREVDVLELDREGNPVRARATVHLSLSPFGKAFELVVSVRTERPTAVYLTRIPNEPSDHERMELAWRLREDGGTRIELGFEAVVSFLPRFVPLAGVGDRIAESVVGSAARTLHAA